MKPAAPAAPEDDAGANPSIGDHVIRGSAWMIGMRWSMRLIGLFSTVIIARLLLPEDFGVIAMAVIVVGLLETVSFNGVDLALIRNDDAGRDHYDTAWTIQLMQSAFVAVLLVLVAAPAGAYFNEPRVVAVIQLLALKPLLDGLQNVGVVAFRKDLDFAKEFRFNLYKKLINFTLIVGAALLLRSYWALVLGMISAAAISTFLSYTMHPYRPRLCLRKVREIWSFSQWLLLYHIGNFLSRKTPQFVLGNSAGATTMGNYHLADEIATMPSVELIMPMHRALFPALSKTQHDLELFRSTMRKTFAGMVMICSLLGFGLAGVADLFVPLVLGPNWLDAIPLMRWLAIFGVLIGMLLILDVPLWVQGKTHVSALLIWAQLLILVPFAMVAVDLYGAQGAAATRLLVTIAILPPTIFVVTRSCPLTAGDLYGGMWRPLLSGLGIFVALTWWQPFAAQGLWQIALLLVIKALCGAALFGASMALLWWLAGRPRGIETIVSGRLAGRFPERLRRRFL